VGVTVEALFDVGPEVLHRIQVWRLRWPIHHLYPMIGEPPLSKLRCMLRVIILLEYDITRSAFIVPSILHMVPTPVAIIQPQTIICPPPNFTVSSMFCGSSSSPFILQHQTSPSDPCRLTLVSSDQTTRFQSSTVQPACCFAKLRRSWICRIVSLGFLRRL